MSLFSPIKDHHSETQLFVGRVILSSVIGVVLLGVVVGLGFGWIAVQAIPGSIIDQFAVPVPSLVLYVIIATLAGLVAASLPARRASRLKVLDAIHQL